jgi:CRP-like cAMP-binding protein
MIIVERGVIRVDQFNDLRNSIWEQKSPIDSPKEEVEYQSVSDFPGFPNWLASDNEGMESTSSGAGMSRPIRSFELGPGCVGGSTDFYLARPHSTHAVCASVACRVLRISKRSMQRMAGESPMSLIVLQLAIMRLNSSDLFSAAEYANTSST